MPVIDNHEYLTEEEKRLKEDRQRKKYWKKWGPYVAERQWATGECDPSTLERIIPQPCKRGLPLTNGRCGRPSQ